MGILDLHLRFECPCCGRTVREIDDEVSYLKNSVPICRECAGKVRILYPRWFTWANVVCCDDEGYDVDEDTIWVDALADMTVDELLRAFPRADEERKNRRERYGVAKAYFKVENVRRRMKDVGKGRKFPGDYEISGMALVGEIASGDLILVHRRERTITLNVERVEWIFRGLSPRKTVVLGEGILGALVFREDTPFIYPGDVLEIQPSEKGRRHGADHKR